MSDSTSQISPEIREQMDAICRRAMSSREGVNRDREELLGHLEDKFVAYLRGDERLTEADAMILVREHFGNPEKLRWMLGEVHESSAPVSLVSWQRRMLFIAFVLAAIFFCEFIVKFAVVDVPLIMALKRDGYASALWAWGGFTIVSSMLASVVAVVLLLLVIRWRRREDADHVGRINHWTNGRLVACTVALLAVREITASLLNQWYYSFPPSAVHGVETPLPLMMGFMQLWLVAAHVQCVVWIFWVARRRPWWVGIAAASGSFAFEIVGNAIYTVTAMAASSEGFFLSRFAMLRGPYHAMVAVDALAVFLTLRIAGWVSLQLEIRRVRPLFSR